jgi:molecular chaperone HscB
MGEVADRFVELDALPLDDPKRPAVRTQIRSLLNAAKYIRGLIRDLHAD